MVVEKTLESPLDCKEIQPVHSKGHQSWVFFGRTDAKAETNTLATLCKELTHWKRPWCWEGLGAGGEGGERGWDGWMASPTRWTWVWVNSGSWWWTGRPGVLWFMRLQRVGHDWATELNWTEWLSNNTRCPEFSACAELCKFRSSSYPSRYKAYFISSYLSQGWIFHYKNSLSRMVTTCSLPALWQHRLVPFACPTQADLISELIARSKPWQWWMSERSAFSFLVTELPERRKQNYFIYFTNLLWLFISAKHFKFYLYF